MNPVSSYNPCYAPVSAHYDPPSEEDDDDSDLVNTGEVQTEEERRETSSV